MIGLFILDSDYDSLLRKGVADGILDRLEDGFLERAITIHPFTQSDRQVDLSPNVTLFEMKQPNGRGPRPVLWFVFLIHLIKVTSRTISLVRQNHVDFIRAQDPYFCGLIGLVVSRLTGRRFCVSIHADYDRMDELDPKFGAPRIFGSRQLACWLERRVLSRADRVLAITGYIAGYARRHGAPAERIRLFRHMVKIDNFSPTPVSSESNLICVVSRLTLQKHILDVARVARALKDRGVRFQIEVAGDGEARADLISLIRELDVEDKVKLLGFQSRGSVAELLARSAVNLCLCGGASLIEAGMIGRPSVAYDWEWHNEVVIDGETGRLVAEGDYEAAAAAIADLLSEPKRICQMGVASGRLMRDMYDLDALLEARRAAYRDLLAIGNAERAQPCG